MATVIWLGGDSGNENDWSVAANWSTGSVPVNGDNVYVLPTANNYAITDGLNQSAVTLNYLYVDKAATGSIGTAANYLRISATTAELNNTTAEEANGQRALNIDFGSNAVNCTIYGSSNNPLSGQTTPIRILGAHASNVLTVIGGTVGVALKAGESSTFPVITVRNSSTVLWLGDAVANVTTLSLTDGRVNSSDPLTARTYTTVNQYSGVLNIAGLSAITTYNLYGGSCISTQTGTIGTLKLYGVFDRTEATSGITITNATIYKGGSLYKRAGDPTFTNPISIANTRLQDITITNQEPESIQFS